MSRLLRNLLIGLAVIALAALGAVGWYVSALSPTPASPESYIRFFKRTEIADVLAKLKDRGVVKNPSAMGLYFSLHHGEHTIPIGTFRIRGGETAQDILDSFREPVRQMVRMPETNWARRDAHLLEKHQVTSAADYMKIVDDPPPELAKLVDFPLPEGSLEGYLYPDTYDFPPLLGAMDVVKRRLTAFNEKVYLPLGKPKKLKQMVIIASLIELEAGNDRDRALISGVIYNRLNKGMPLQLDAAILYGLGKWRRLHYSDYKNVKSPYNLYLHKGLPPGPICSPSLKSMEAAINPAKHHYLYYIAFPKGGTVYAATYAEHLKNVKKRDAELKAAAERKAILKGLLSANPAKP